MKNPTPLAADQDENPAQSYRRMGYKPIVLHGIRDGRCTCGAYPCSKENRNAGKHPVAKGWQHTIAESIPPGRNVGLAMGLQPDGRRLVAIDADGPGIIALQEHYGGLPETLTQRSGSGGVHLIYTVPKDARIRNSVNVQGAKFDVRCDGGQIVVAPSVHISGDCYEWIDDRDPVPLPESWLRLISGVPTALPDLDVPKLLNTQTPNRATRDTARQCAIDWCKRAPVAVSGAAGQTDLFNLLSTLIMGYALDVDTADAIAREHYNPRCDPPWDLDDPSDARDWQHKLDDAAQATRDPEYLIDAYESETFSPAGIKDRCAGDGSAWFEDEDFGQMLALYKSDELKYMRVIHEIEKQLPRKAKELNKAIRKAARETSKPTRNVDRTKREIIAYDSVAWVADGNGGYYESVKRSNLVAFLNNLGRSDLVCGTAEATWNHHANIASKCIRNFAQRERARWVDPRTIHTGCPFPEIAPVKDEEVDAWLRAMFDAGFPAFCQWLRANTPEHADRLAAALTIIGPTSGGKSFLAMCMAWLWGATSYVRLGVAVSRFNASCESTPVWCDDECVELQRGEFTASEFVDLIQRRDHDVERKGIERTKLLGPCRLVLLCNDPEQLKFGKSAGFEAMRALEGRLSVHDFRERGPMVLAALDKLRLPGENNADVPRVLGHLRWLQETTTLQPARFAGACGGIALVQQAALSQHPEVFDAISEALAAFPADSKKGDEPYACPAGGWLLRKGDDLYVNPAGLATAHEKPLRAIQDALRPHVVPADRKCVLQLPWLEGKRRGVKAWRLPAEVVAMLHNLG